MFSSLLCSQRNKHVRTCGKGGYSLPEVMVAMFVGVLMTVAVTAVVGGAVRLVGSVENGAVGNTLPAKVAYQIGSQLESADIIVPVNAKVNGNSGQSQFYNTSVAFIMSSGEYRCEFHNYFLKTKNVGTRTAELRHFVKVFSFNPSVSSSINASSSCLTYYSTIVNASAGDRSSCYLSSASVGSSGNFLGGRCEVLLENVYASDVVFQHLGPSGESLPQVGALPSDAPGYNLPSSGVLVTPAGPKCVLDSNIVGVSTPIENWAGPGLGLTTVKVLLVVPGLQSNPNVLSKQVTQFSATPKYISLGGVQC